MLDARQSDSDRSQTTEFVIGSVHGSTHFILPEPGPIFQDHGCEWSLCCRQTNVRLVRVWVGQDCGRVLWDNVCCCFSTSRVVWTDSLCLCAFRGCLLGTSQPHLTVDCQLKKLCKLKPVQLTREDEHTTALFRQ